MPDDFGRKTEEEKAQETQVLIGCWVLVAAAAVANAATLRVFKHQKAAGKSVFIYQAATTVNDMRFAAIGGLLITFIYIFRLITFSNQFNEARLGASETDASESRSVVLDIYVMQLGFLLLFATQVNNGFLLAAASIDRHKSLSRLTASYFNSATYKQRSKRIIAACNAVSLFLVFGVFAADPTTRLPFCFCVALVSVQGPGTGNSPGDICHRIRYFPPASLGIGIVLGSASLAALVCGGVFLRTYRRTTALKVSVAATKTNGPVPPRSRKMAIILSLEIVLSLVSFAVIPASEACHGDSGSPCDVLVPQIFTEVAIVLVEGISIVSNFVFFFALSRTFRKDLRHLVTNLIRPLTHWSTSTITYMAPVERSNSGGMR